MQIVQENINDLEAILKVELTEEDYSEKVSKELKNMQRKAQMPGFRPGKVPFGMVQKMYGRAVMVEEINKILADAVTNYVKDNNLNILGHPLPDQGHADTIDWENQKDFQFRYEIGLAPEVTISLSDAIEVDYYKISVSDDTLEKYLTDIRRRYGKMIQPEESASEDVLSGLFEEMDSEESLKEGGKSNKSNLYIQFIKDENVKSRLVGLKPGSQLVFNPIESVGSETEAAAMLGVKKEELGTLQPLFRFTVDGISRIEPAELDETLYEKAAPGKEIKTEEAFRAFLKEQIALQYQGDVDRHFRNDVMKNLVDLSAMILPEAFLKKWLLDANKDELTEEQIDKDFNGFIDSFKWQLIENHLIKTHNLQVSPDEIREHLDSYFRAQLKQYGQENPEQEMIDQFVKNILGKEDEIKKVYDHLYDQKLLALYKETLKLKETELTIDEFVKLVSEKYNS